MVSCQCLKVFPKLFILFVGNGEFGMGFLSRPFEEHDLSTYDCNFIQIP
jgi:hypothetical protein